VIADRKIKATAQAALSIIAQNHQNANQVANGHKRIGSKYIPCCLTMMDLACNLHAGNPDTPDVQADLGWNLYNWDLHKMSPFVARRTELPQMLYPL